MKRVAPGPPRAAAHIEAGAAHARCMHAHVCVCVHACRSFMQALSTLLVPKQTRQRSRATLQIHSSIAKLNASFRVASPLECLTRVGSHPTAALSYLPNPSASFLPVFFLVRLGGTGEAGRDVRDWAVVGLLWRTDFIDRIDLQELGRLVTRDFMLEVALCKRLATLTRRTC
eukprot:914046-Pelagomonas_calceolata.AAC.5